MHIIKNAKYLRVPKSSKELCSQIYIYVEGILKKAIFITPGTDSEFVYYPLYKFKNEEVMIDVSHESLLEEELVFIM